MIILRKEKHVFKKGEKYHLDSVYHFFALFPNDNEKPFYHQDDIADLQFYSQTTSKDGSENDCGEYVKILRNFTIEFTVKGDTK